MAKVAQRVSTTRSKKPDLPRSREKNVTGAGKSIYKRGSASKRK